MEAELVWVVPVGVYERIDRGLALAWPAHSRSRFGVWIAEGRVTVDGKIARASARLTPGQEVRVDVPPIVASSLLPEALDVPVLYEDEHLVVVVKPAGMAVHPSAGHRSGTLVNALLAQVTGLSGIGGEERPGIVHRLDLGTSGVMVVAKNDAAHRRLGVAFAAHDLERRYLAVVHRGPLHDTGVFESSLARDPANRLKIASVVTPSSVIDDGDDELGDDFYAAPVASPPSGRRAGRRAVTHWRVQARADRAALVSCRLETGRTHQVRVHLSEAGSPIFGDSLYGRRDCVAPSHLRASAEALTHPLLHAFRLGFDHPITGERLCFDAPPPEDFLGFCAIAGLRIPDFAAIKD